MEKFFYFASVFGGLKNVLIFALIICCIVAITYGIMYAEDRDKDDKKSSKKYFIIALILSVIVIFVPGKKTYILMTGGKLVDELIEGNEKVKELPSKTIDLLDAELEKLLKDAKGD